MSQIKSKINRKSNKAVATSRMQFVSSTSKFKLNSISLNKHSAIIPTEVCTSLESTNKITTSKAITEIHRLQRNFSSFPHIIKLLIPTDEPDNQANTGAPEHRKREPHRYHPC